MRSSGAKCITTAAELPLRNATAPGVATHDHPAATADRVWPDDPVCRRLPVIPQVNYQSLPCGHYPQEEAPEALVATLLAFHSSEQKYRNGVFSNLKAADQPG